MIVSVMRISVIALKPSSTLREAVELMLEKNIGRILIVDDRERLVEIVDREDFIKAML